ncbi:hypothetical protein [Candidatus Parabeggiatoa sp. HSG14]|uniref:hypothetical protein n=1 Tax=Candidatus Parabeggiatoa sp. HSG14 TaxID=3055593 RepID=UPI0025A86907|nr:hypothetical protein [Thiotrichales bacterium HSG14]
MMSTLTIELPEILDQQIKTCRISQQGLEQMFICMMQTYLHEYKATPVNDKALPTSIALNGDTFARQVIANNRELFEELARL